MNCKALPAKFITDQPFMYAKIPYCPVWHLPSMRILGHSVPKKCKIMYITIIVIEKSLPVNAPIR